MEKWMSACEEEGWLEDYNKDENRFASKGAHLNLKRAEHARAAINKLPGNYLPTGQQRTCHLSRHAKEDVGILPWSLNLGAAWEDDRGVPFMFDGVRLLSMLDGYNYLQQEKDEEKRRLRDQKKIQEQLITEQETLFGSKPIPIKTTLSSKKAYAALNYVALNQDETAGLASTDGRSAAAVAAGRGEQQQKVVQAPALRQPLSPVVMSVTQQQIYVEDSGNRLQVSNNNKASSFAKRSMTGISPPTSPPHPRLQGSENTTPMHSFDKRRFSSIIGQTR
ncbi:unnamed protein product [Sphagnum jensenii]|uniref:Uncharacterized protein n=1 Tax=Sphagnum jensenii TaxID=128206 RepID=A0ABP1AFT0_9BRYO